MRGSRVAAAVALLAAFATIQPSWAQGNAPPPGDPSFLSGGLRFTIASIAVSKIHDRLTVALVIENQRDEGVLVAMVGPALAIDNRGNTFATGPGGVGGLAGCGTHYGAAAVPGVLVATPEGRKACLERVLTTPESYTTVDKHQSTVATLSFAIISGDARNLGNRFTFSSDMAVRTDGGDSLQGKSMGPARLIGAGVALIPVAVE